MATTAPSELMTRDDFIHAANRAREEGGHFMSSLAKAYVHADGGNVRPLREHYHGHFFRFLSRERQVELTTQYEALASTRP